MKRYVLAFAAILIAAATLNVPAAEAGGRVGFHFSPVFIPKPTYGGSYGRRSWNHEGRYERRRRLRALRLKRLRAAKKRRAIIERKKRIEAARRRKAIEAEKRKRIAKARAAAERRNRIAAAKRKAAEKRKAEIAAAGEAKRKAEAATPPPAPPKKEVASTANAPVPTEALLTKQEISSAPAAKSSTVANSKVVEPATAKVDAIKPRAGISGDTGCKKFLPGAGVTISVPCSE